MYAQQLVIVLVTISLGLLSASIPNATVEQDSADLSKLVRQIKELSPVVARQFLQASCQMSVECCPQPSSSSVSVAVLFNVTTVLERCFGKLYSHEFLEKYLPCTPVAKLTELASDPNLNKLIAILATETSEEEEDMKSIVDVCEGKELYAVACDWDAHELHQTCRQKLVKRWAEQYDEVEYHKRVEKRRQTYQDIISKLKTLFNS
jgi:hypothetical protein